MYPPVLPTYARFDVAFERGEGAYVYDDNGERYLDFGGGIAVNALGHAHPHLVKTLTEQAGKLWHTSNLYRIPDQERLAKRLVDATFADTVFFGNSGVEAIEASIKMARRYQYKNGHPGALPHHHLRRRVPWAHAGGDRGRRTGEISRRLRAEDRRLRPGRVRRSQAGRAGHRAGDRRDPDRADPGRGRVAPRDRRIPARACASCATSTDCC